MYRIRLLLFITITWLFIVISIEDIFARTTLSFLNISPVVYILMIGIFTIFLALPEAGKLFYAVIGLVGVFIGPIITNIFRPGEPILFNVLLEIVVLSLTTIIGYYLSQWFFDYHTGIRDSVFRSTEAVIDTVFSDVEKIERKISRARRFENELALININLSNTINNGVDKDQLTAYLAETLQIIENTGVINAWHDNILMICVPASAQSTQVGELTRNLNYLIKDILNTDNELQVSSFPKDGLVLNDLLTKVSNNSDSNGSSLFTRYSTQEKSLQMS